MAMGFGMALPAPGGTAAAGALPEGAAALPEGAASDGEGAVVSPAGGTVDIPDIGTGSEDSGDDEVSI